MMRALIILQRPHNICPSTINETQKGPIMIKYENKRHQKMKLNEKHVWLTHNEHNH